jgi:hypothetical protein
MNPAQVPSWHTNPRHLTTIVTANPRHSPLQTSVIATTIELPNPKFVSNTPMMAYPLTITSGQWRSTTAIQERTRNT